MNEQRSPEDRLAAAREELRLADLAVQEKRRNERREQQEQARIARDNHRALLAADAGLANHPKLDKLYDLAWSYGHSGGWGDVEAHFHEFAELLQP
jgi:hypothetical protein